MTLSSSDRVAVAAILSDFFHHEGFLDVVPSDVVAGILLVRFQQRIAALNVFIPHFLLTRLLMFVETTIHRR